MGGTVRPTDQWRRPTPVSSNRIKATLFDGGLVFCAYVYFITCNSLVERLERLSLFHKFIIQQFKKLFAFWNWVFFQDEQQTGNVDVSLLFEILFKQKKNRYFEILLDVHYLFSLKKSILSSLYVKVLLKSLRTATFCWGLQDINQPAVFCYVFF